MKNSMRKGLGFYLILFFLGFCIVLWLQNRNASIDVKYTIDDFQRDVREELVGDVAIYQNSEVPTGIVRITYIDTQK